MLSFEKSPNGYYIVRTQDGRTYGWKVSDNMFHDLTTSNYKIEILHNYMCKAMINVSNPATGRDVRRQEINALTHVDVGEWVVDNQVEPPAEENQ